MSLFADSIILRKLVDSVSDAIIVTDGDFVIRGWNRAAEQIYGYSAEEVVGQAQPLVLQSNFSTAERAAAIEQLSTVGHWEGEVWQRRKDGSRCLVSAAVTRLRDGDDPLIVAVNRDITEQWRTRARLRRRDAIMEAISYVAEQLLETQHQPEVLRRVMKRLGEATDVSRAYLFRRHPEEVDRPVVSQVAEWVAPGVEPQIDNPALQNVDLATPELQRWGGLLVQGETVVGHVRDFPASERALLEPQGIYSLCVVPIFAESRWWGFVGFDECRAEREWTDPEQEALQTAARILGGAFRNQEAEEALRALAQRMQQIVETERQRIARDLHDGVGQSINALGIDLNLVRQFTERDPVQAKQWLDKSSEMVERTLGLLRDVIEGLRPTMLDDYGLCAALDAHAAEFAERTGLAVDLNCDLHRERLPAALEISLFRIAQEALTNVAKHAAATEVDIVLDRLDDRLVRLQIRDDGRGFDATTAGAGRSGWGMVTMRERALASGGTLTVESTPGRGTRIEATVSVA